MGDVNIKLGAGLHNLKVYFNKWVNCSKQTLV